MKRKAPESSRSQPNPISTVALALFAAVSLPGCVPIPVGDEPAAEERWPLSWEEIQALLAEDHAGQDEGVRVSEHWQPLPPASEFLLYGSLDMPEDYELFALGPSAAGDAWTIGHEAGTDRLTLTVFEPGLNLRHRFALSKRVPMEFTLRQNVQALYVGIQLRSNAMRDDYTIRAKRVCCRQAILSRRQIVWLNFAGATDVKVNQRFPALSFEPFDSSMLGGLYQNETAEIKQMIIDTLERTYADYDIEIVSSDDAVRPDEPHSVIHFGGYEEGLLGVAESVDANNTDRGDEAIVYVENFDTYWDYEPPPSVLGTVIGNVAAHELRHLLGLHHACEPSNIMTIAPRSHWALAGRQYVLHDYLDPNIFPIGRMDAPGLLFRALGLRPVPLKAESALTAAKRAQVAQWQKLPGETIGCYCGLCTLEQGE